jgi:hypothetical protein
MPEFIAEHVPSAGLDSFTRDYLEAVEWLLGDGVDRSKIRGFTRAAIKLAKQDCAEFQQQNAENLALYEEATGYTGGVDFWLTRNHHGAGFWDRGDESFFKELTDAAHAFGSLDSDVYRGWISL